MKAERITNIAGVSACGTLGIVALAGALFAGATHQFAVAAICAIMTWVQWAEVRRQKRKAKTTKEVEFVITT